MTTRRLDRLFAAGSEETRDLFGLMKCRELTSAGKLSLAAAKLRNRVGGLKHDVVVDCGVARIRFGRESFAVDWYVFEEIFLKRVYERLSFERARVLDVGAHKGYFAAYALSHGASSVVSFEPEAGNFGRLAAAAKGVPEWTVRREAVAGESGIRMLRIKEAWSHTLVTPGSDDDGVAVRVVALGEILGAHAGERQLVKVDIEGAECEALAQAPTKLLGQVDELVVEAHATARCGATDIVAIAEAAGLRGMDLDLDHPAPLLRFRGIAAA